MNNFEENGIELDGLNDVDMDINMDIDEVESENVNLISIAIDESGSMGNYRTDMNNCLDEFKNALLNSKEVDEILLSRINFDDDVEIKGYQKVDEFDTSFKTGGCTALYDSIKAGTENLINYRKQLKDNGMRVKSVFAVFSDGEDNMSNTSLSETKQIVETLNKEEITTAFITFGSDAQGIGKSLGFRNILDVSSSASELRKAFNCLSKSVIESSKSVVSDGDDFFQM